MYKLYLDKPENFECEVSVKNASLKGSVARLIMESNDGINFVFNGKIENGKCVVPIRRLKGLLDENSKGNIYLEMIVEDTYFKPWKSDFVVEEHTSVKVTVNETRVSNKPIVNVNVPNAVFPQPPKGINMWLPLYEITQMCKKFGITRKNVQAQKNEFRQIVSEYFNNNPEFVPHKTAVIGNLKHFLT